jgi:hypothetical protein
MRFGAAKSPVTERPVKAKTEDPAVRQTSYLPGGSIAQFDSLASLLELRASSMTQTVLEQKSRKT